MAVVRTAVVGGQWSVVSGGGDGAGRAGARLGLAVV